MTSVAHANQTKHSHSLRESGKLETLLGSTVYLFQLHLPCFLHVKVSEFEESQSRVHIHSLSGLRGENSAVEKSSLLGKVSLGKIRKRKGWPTLKV